jgi:hypothetical protein
MIEIIVNDSNEDNMLSALSTTDITYAIVMRKGHKWIDKYKFIELVSSLGEFFIAGHVLDRTPHNAYYELHHQCYVINLKTYRRLRFPEIGQQTFNDIHQQFEPLRSKDNIHDDYTPLWVNPGAELKTYSHKAHGWNILSTAFRHDLPVLVFNNEVRLTKDFNYEANR